MIYFIYYHSSDPDLLNNRVLDVVKEFPGWAVLSPSFFLVRLKKQNTDDRDANLFIIKNKINLVCDPNDEFFVGQLGDESTWQGYGSRLKEWLIKNTLQQDEGNQENFSLKEAAKAAHKALIATKQKETQVAHEAPIYPNKEHASSEEDMEFEEVR